jgi:hypothetical protein
MPACRSLLAAAGLLAIAGSGVCGEPVAASHPAASGFGDAAPGAAAAVLPAAADDLEISAGLSAGLSAGESTRGADADVTVSRVSRIVPPRHNVQLMLRALAQADKAAKRVRRDERAELRAPSSLEEVILHAIHAPRRLEVAEVVVAREGRGEVLHAAKYFLDFVLERALTNRRPRDPVYVRCMRRIERVQQSMGDAADVLVSQGEGEGEGEGEPMYRIPLQVTKSAARMASSPGSDAGGGDGGYGGRLATSSSSAAAAEARVGHPFRIVAGRGLFEVVRKVARSCYYKAHAAKVRAQQKRYRTLLKAETRLLTIKGTAIARRMRAQRRVAALQKRILALGVKISRADRRIGTLRAMTKSINWVGRLREALKQRDKVQRAQLAEARVLRREFDRNGETKMPLGKAAKKRFVTRLNSAFDRRVKGMTTNLFQSQLSHFLQLYLNEGSGASPAYHLRERRRFAGRVVGAGVGGGTDVVGKNADRDYNPEPHDGPLDQDVRRTGPPLTITAPGSDKPKLATQLWPPGLRSSSDRN